ncbi:LacI family DNA-binding transcriptional regulator [Telmatospirillum siberiense]|uniref:LacI family transcriptional regulator n=1 Tax=Telmatospirillum siberiense TaxID=382514 RepID=A0A2N3PX37_9PROT|nr:LacI family DNA-binding transcriptional regulator [Telmatospirillum siberiense]PKU24957.1 LacI family transcriptional regulator [Telmatospirillum siberiense]
MRRVTVHDVAAEAGVSLATVDRVINGRKGVSATTVQRVNKVIERLDFRRDVFAASLATSREYRFKFVLPEVAGNTFMTHLGQQVRTAARRLADQRILVSEIHYREFDSVDLCRVLGCIDLAETMGVAVVAIDTPEVREAIDALVERGIGVVTLVSDVTPSRRLDCIGINNLAAGRVAASLLGRFLGGRTGSIALIAGFLMLDDHVARRLGFEQTMLRDFPGQTLLPVVEGRDDSRVTAPLVGSLLDEHPDLIGLYSMGAGNRGIIEALERRGRQRDVAVVAHELTPHSRRALISGTFDAVIHQEAGDEVENAVQTLKAFSDGRAGFIPPRVRIDIFVRDNLP